MGPVADSTIDKLLDACCDPVVMADGYDGASF
jgi:hypothetical protein